MAVKSIAQKRKFDELLASGKMSPETHEKMTADLPGDGKLPSRTTWPKMPGASSFKVKILRAQKVSRK